MEAQELTALFGIWFFDWTPSGETGIFVLTPELRAVQFSTSVSFPKANETMRLWAEPGDGLQIHFRFYPAGSSWTRGVEFQGDGWTMFSHGKDGTECRSRCRPARPDELPAWFQEQLEKQLNRMIEMEKAVPLGTPDGR